MDKDRLIMAMAKLREAKQTTANLYAVTNDIYIQLYDNQSRYLVLVGGGGSGKSIFAGQKILHRLTSETGHRILVVRKVARTLRESCFTQLRSQISEYYDSNDFDINKTDMRISYKRNGNEILFAGLDDVEKLKSIYNVTSIWIEEASELDIEDYRQLDIRLRGTTKHYKQIIITFNPVSITHWLKTEFFDVVKDDCTTLHTTYHDNKFLDDAAIKVLEGFRDTDPYYYSVYCLGEWGVLGKTIFDAQKVTDRLVLIRDKQPVKVGQFEYEYKHDKIVDGTVKWVDDVNGCIRIYKDVDKATPYVIGGDTSGEGSDYFIGQVLDNVTGEQVATLRHQFDEDLYAKQIYCLGKYYNNSLVGIEVNYSTYPVKELDRLGYNRQYVREQIDTITGNVKMAYGFRTDKMSRPLVIAALVQIVRDHTSLFNDVNTLDEMLTFVRNEDGRAEAQSGKHDDCIMGMAIAHFIRGQQSYKKVEDKKSKYYDDDDDDFKDEDEGGWFS